MNKRPSPKLTALLVAIAAAVVGLDQLVKYLARVHLDTDEVYLFIPKILHLQLQMNDGASLGMLSGSRVMLVAVSAIASVFMVLLMVLYRNLSTGERISVALILGGAVGNLIDRVATGFVTDMLFFPWIGKIPLLPDFICNIADIAITFGVAALVISFFIDAVKEKREMKAAEAKAEAVDEDGNTDE